MYRYVNVISEGRTESDFVKNVLSAHLINYGVIASPSRLPTGRGSAGINKGGWRRTDGYKFALEQVRKMIITRADVTYTTLFDFYGFPNDIPCYNEAKELQSPYAKVELYEDRIKKDVCALLAEEKKFNSDLFIPYVQPYEFESFLFVDPKCTASVFYDRDTSKALKLENEIRKIASGVPSPEHINEHQDTAPSKRIEKLVPGFVKNKAGRAGLSWKVPQRVGIDVLRQSCKHFDKWLSRLEALGGSI